MSPICVYNYIAKKKKKETLVKWTAFLSINVDIGDNSCSGEDRWENKCLEQLCRCIPCGAAESRSLSGVTATAESTPGSTDTVISPPVNGGECRCVRRNLYVCVSVGRRWEKRRKSRQGCACVSVHVCASVCWIYKCKTSWGLEITKKKWGDNKGEIKVTATSHFASAISLLWRCAFWENLVTLMW